MVQGPWSQVAAVMAFGASASVNGIHVGTWQHFGLSLEDGQALRFQSQAKEAFAVASLAQRYAAPVINPRVLARLDAGQTVEFGPVSLSQTTIGFKKKSWPLGAIAGHRTFQGSWMMDTGPKNAPSLSVQVQLNQVPNFFALRAALERLKPGSEYPENGPDLGTMFRPSASSHDPRYPAGRTRLLLLGGLVGVGAIAGLTVLGVSTYQSNQRMEEWLAGEARMAALMAEAEAISVPAGQAFVCEKTVKDVYDVVFATRGPKGIDRPGLLDQNDAFSLDSSGPSVVSPFDDSPYMVLGEVRGVLNGTVTVAMKVLDTKSHSAACAGELIGRFDPGEKHGANFAIEDLLVMTLCKNTKEARCARAMERTRLVTRGAVGAERVAPNPKTVAASPKPVVKKKAPEKR